MSGFYGIYSIEQDHPEKVYRQFFSYKFDNIINEEFRYKHFTFGRSVLNKFSDDRILLEDEKYIIVFEGICFNNKPKPIQNFIIDLYEQHPDELAKYIDGHFAGFIYDKTLNKLIIFNDHLASKPVYFFSDPKRRFFIFSSELKVAAKILGFFKIPKNYDLPGIYSFLAFGYYLGQHTNIQEIKRLGFASNFQLDANTFKTKSSKYFDYVKSQDSSLNKKTILENIENLLLKSVKKEWDKDNEYKCDHYALLSGGLDSRVNILIASKLGLAAGLHTITFAESGSDDDKIAQEIADEYNFKHTFQPLDNGTYLSKGLENYVYANDGIVNLLGSAHGFFTLSKFDHSAYGLLHTGQIGDLLFGSHSFKVTNLKERLFEESDIDKNYLQDKFPYFESIIDKYQDLSYEQFVYEQKAINGVLNGDRTNNHFSDMTSPFYNKELISFCLTIPDKYKQSETIYFEWMRKYHPELIAFKWEKAGVKPSNEVKVKAGIFIKRAKTAALRKLNIHTGMNPLEKWANTNSLILSNLDNNFKSCIDHILEPVLKQELIQLYNNTSNVSLKLRIVTLLISIKILF